MTANTRPRPVLPRSVLFVCNMNQIRSPMAEYLTRDLFGAEIFVQSAGIYTGDHDGFMQAVMAERNLDVADHQPQGLEELDDHFVDLVITLTGQAHEATVDFFADAAVEIEFWDTENPSVAVAVGRRDDVLAAYRKTRNELEARIRERFG